MFCFSDFPLRDKHDHEYFCGAKTEKCSRCEKYVVLRDMDIHISMDCHPEKVTIADQIDLNNIQVKNRKYSTKNNTPGVIGIFNYKK
jgi:hypothetical protein